MEPRPEWENRLLTDPRRDDYWQRVELAAPVILAGLLQGPQNDAIAITANLAVEWAIALTDSVEAARGQDEEERTHGADDATKHSADRLAPRPTPLQACRAALTALTNLSTAQFAAGGDRPIRALLAAAIDAAAEVPDAG